MSGPVHRRTLGGPARVTGRGLFTGAPAAAALVPAPPESGIVFIRIDLPGAPRIPALAANLVRDPRALGLALPAPARNTVLAGGPQGPVVVTVEHVLSALAGMGVTDALVEVSGPELPIGDASGAPFARAIAEAGVTVHGDPVAPIAPAHEILVGDPGGPHIVARPASVGRYRYELDYGAHAALRPHGAAWTQGEDYAATVAPARTFCLQEEAEAMRRAGLFAHLSTRDMLVIGPGGPIDNAYLFDDEPARHKLLDLIGDLALAGRPIRAEVIARRSGHALNHEMARRLAAL